jgi:hypothetical protein
VKLEIYELKLVIISSSGKSNAFRDRSNAFSCRSNASACRGNASIKEQSD